MKLAKFTGALLVLAMLLTVSAQPVRGVESGLVWLSAIPAPAGSGTEALIVTDALAADGLICVHYDSSCLSYTGLLAAEETVAQYAVNAREPGLVKISWVSGSYQAAGDGKLLFRLCFEGADAKSITLTGQVHDVLGQEIPFGAPDSSALETAISAAELLKEADYSPADWESLVSALERGRSVLADPMASAWEMNRAAREIRNAMENLRVNPPRADTANLELAVEQARKLDPERYMPDGLAAVAAALERALAVLEQKEPVQEDVDTALRLLQEAVASLKELPEEIADTEAACVPEESSEPKVSYESQENSEPEENTEAEGSAQTGKDSGALFAWLLAGLFGTVLIILAVFWLRSRRGEGTA